MHALSGPRVEKHALDVLVGVEAGVIGGAVMLIWLAIMSPLIGDPWWLIPNLFASYFYSEAFVRLGPGMVTLVGSAIHLFASGVVGAISGILTPGGRLFGLGVALVWYVVCYLFLWKRLAPLIPAHASQPLMMVGYFLFGSALGWHRHLVAAAKVR